MTDTQPADSAPVDPAPVDPAPAGTAPTGTAAGEAPLLYDVSGHVATITLNRPHRRNAISHEMLDLLALRLVEANRDRGVRAVVLTGAGKGFCAGLDITDTLAGEGIGTADAGSVSAGVVVRDLPPVVLHEMDTPVIAAVNGAAAGYGLDLALGADIRLGGPSTRLVPAFTKRGVVPESGGTWLLPRLLGWAKASEVALLGRDLDAAAAREMGLLNHVVASDDELVATAQEWAAEIATNAPLAVQATKRLFRHGLSQDFQSHTDHVLLQVESLFHSADFREGLLSFTERRPPEFQGR